jgi:hypothetical protein
LFSLLYSSTNLCGDQFYACAKGLNAIFLLGIIALVWILAMRLFGLLAAVVASTATALSPISVYVSFFMPDTMFFFFVVLFFKTADVSVVLLPAGSFTTKVSLDELDVKVESAKYCSKMNLIFNNMLQQWTPQAETCT